MILSQSELNSCVSGKMGNPHAFLGLHSLGANKRLVARAIDPFAERVFVVNRETKNIFPLLKITGFIADHKNLLDINLGHLSSMIASIG